MHLPFVQVWYNPPFTLCGLFVPASPLPPFFIDASRGALDRRGEFRLTSHHQPHIHELHKSHGATNVHTSRFTEDENIGALHLRREARAQGLRDDASGQAADAVEGIRVLGPERLDLLPAQSQFGVYIQLILNVRTDRLYSPSELHAVV